MTPLAPLWPASDPLDLLDASGECECGALVPSPRTACDDCETRYADEAEADRFYDESAADADCFYADELEV